MGFQDLGGGRAGCGLGCLWVLWHSQIPLTLSCTWEDWEAAGLDVQPRGPVTAGCGCWNRGGC